VGRTDGWMGTWKGDGRTNRQTGRQTQTHRHADTQQQNQQNQQNQWWNRWNRWRWIENGLNERQMISTRKSLYIFISLDASWDTIGSPLAYQFEFTRLGVISVNMSICQFSKTLLENWYSVNFPLNVKHNLPLWEIQIKSSTMIFQSPFAPPSHSSTFTQIPWVHPLQTRWYGSNGREVSLAHARSLKLSGLALHWDLGSWSLTTLSSILSSSERQDEEERKKTCP